MDVTLPYHRDERYAVALAMFKADPLGLLAFYQAADQEWRTWANEVLWAELLHREMHMDLTPWADTQDRHALRHLFTARIFYQRLTTNPNVGMQQVTLSNRDARYSVRFQRVITRYAITFSASTSNAGNARFIRQVSKMMRNTISKHLPPNRFHLRPLSSFSVVENSQFEAIIDGERHRERYSPRDVFVTIIYSLLHRYHFRWTVLYSASRKLSLFSCITCNADNPMRVCGACEAIPYCSDACADAHWEAGGHAKTCQSGAK